MNIVQTKYPLVAQRGKVEYLNEHQANAMTEAWQEWYENTKTPGLRRLRGKYWLTYLMLRFTGCRLGECLLIDDTQDIDYRNYEIKILTLKLRRRTIRTVPVPPQVVAEILRYLAEFPDQRGKVFRVQQGNFRRMFYELAQKANIPKHLGHPHVLRHTRAIEMLKAGVPITSVQDILGHSSVSTTAIYLRLSGAETKLILKERGLI